MEKSRLKLFLNLLQHYPDALGINNTDCFLSCPPDLTEDAAAGPGCVANTCCGPQRVGNSDVVDAPSEGDLLIVTGNNSC